MESKKDKMVDRKEPEPEPTGGVPGTVMKENIEEKGLEKLTEIMNTLNLILQHQKSLAVQVGAVYSKLEQQEVQETNEYVPQ